MNLILTAKRGLNVSDSTTYYFQKHQNPAKKADKSNSKVKDVPSTAPESLNKTDANFAFAN